MRLQCACGKDDFESERHECCYTCRNKPHWEKEAMSDEGMSDEGMSIEAVRERLTAPTSLGYEFTHYKQDVAFLLDEIDRFKAQLAEKDEFIKEFGLTYEQSLERNQHKIAALERERDGLREAAKEEHDFCLDYHFSGGRTYRTAHDEDHCKLCDALPSEKAP